jgi:hypothetical protein
MLFQRCGSKWYLLARERSSGELGEPARLIVMRLLRRYTALIDADRLSLPSKSPIIT